MQLQVLLYAAVTMALIFPFDIFYLSTRYFLLRTLWRIVFPLQASFQCCNYVRVQILLIVSVQLKSIVLSSFCDLLVIYSVFV